MREFLKKYIRHYDRTSYQDWVLLFTWIIGIVSMYDMAAWLQILTEFGSRDTVQLILTVSGMLVFMNHFLDDMHYKSISRLLHIVGIITFILIGIAYVVDSVQIMVITVEVTFTMFFITYEHMYEFHLEYAKDTDDSFSTKYLGSRKRVIRAMAAAVSLLFVWISPEWDAMTFVVISTELSLVVLFFFVRGLERLHDTHDLMVREVARRRKLKTP